MARRVFRAALTMFYERGLIEFPISIQKIPARAWQIYGLYYHDDSPGGGCVPAFGFNPVLFGIFFSMSERLISIYTSDESSGFFMIG